MRRILLLAALLAVLPRVTMAQVIDSAWVAENYVKEEVRIPMRDGVRLFTAIYRPKSPAGARPVILRRTPYSVGLYGPGKLNEPGGLWADFMRLGYVMVLQDVRGAFMSEGVWTDLRPVRERRGPRETDETTDAWDTVDWLVRNVAGNNGRVGMYGVSYPGFFTALAGIGAHPALKVISPQAPALDVFLGDDFHHNGAFFLAHAFHFLNGFGFPRPEPRTRFHPGVDTGPIPDGYRFFLELGPLPSVGARFFGDSVAVWDSMMAHGTYDEYWRSRNYLRHLRGLPPAVLSVGGWFDAEDLYGPLQVYTAAERQNPRIANHLVMGPWTHGGWSEGDAGQVGDIRFGATGPFFRDSVFIPFFRHHLEGAPDPRLPEAYAFETGTNRWRRHDAWPPRDARPRTLYLREGGRLAWEAPPAAAGEGAHDEYRSDPARPVPHIGWTAPGMTSAYMTADQRFAARRPDVLVYETAPLEEDLTLAGPVSVALHVSTTGTDADWVVKLIDVHPDSTPDPEPNPAGVRMGGYQQLVRGEPFRGKFRESFERPVPFVPGAPARVAYAMPDVYHTFRRGHRIMVQVQSSWFPLVDRNPQTFVDIYHARETDFRAATHRVHRSAALPSSLTVGVLERGAPGR